MSDREAECQAGGPGQFDQRLERRFVFGLLQPGDLRLDQPNESRQGALAEPMVDAVLNDTIGDFTRECGTVPGRTELAVLSVLRNDLFEGLEA